MAAYALFKDSDKPTTEHDFRLLRGVASLFSDRRMPIYLLMGVSALFGWAILASFVPSRAAVLGLTAWQIGTILTVSSLVYSLAAYAAGFMSDKYGRKTFVVFSQIMMAAAAFGLMRSNGFVGLLAFYSLFCVGESITYLLCFVYASGAFRQEYMARSMGVFDSVIDLSLLVGPAIAVSMYAVIGRMEPVFLLAAVPAVLGLFVTAAALPRDRKPPVL
jgi:MFS family permease